jgi:hypothetical protein
VHVCVCVYVWTRGDRYAWVTVTAAPGKHIVTASEDGALVLWDPKTAQRVFRMAHGTIRTHRGIHIEAAVFTHADTRAHAHTHALTQKHAHGRVRLFFCLCERLSVA